MYLNHFEDYSHLQRLHVWGYPTFVLNPWLQDGKKPQFGLQDISR